MTAPIESLTDQLVVRTFGARVLLQLLCILLPGLGAAQSLPGAATAVGAGAPAAAIPAALPSGWTSRDIGSPQTTGTADFNSGIYGVRGAGRDIWGSNDEFHYLYRRVDGDVDIVARVRYVQAVDPWTKAGVMIRDALTPNAAHFSMFVTPGKGIAFERRESAGGPSRHTTTGAARAPFWVRLERRGAAITVFQSTDGNSWNRVGTGTLALPGVYIGLAVSSHNATTAATALFDRVTVSTPNPNQPPTVSLTAPANNATFTPPASVDIAATAADADGTVARVDFYGGNTLIGSDTSAPYEFRWDGLPVGTYTVKAVATDDEGATTTSATRTFTVRTPTNQPPAVALTTPTDGDTFTAPATITIQATASDADGTVAGVDFYAGTTLVGTDAASPYEVTWNNVPAGSYSLTAVARDNGGASTTSAARTISVTTTIPPLPSGWSSRDVGQPPVAGSATHNAGTFTLRGAGDTASTTDQFHYAYRSFTGDVEIVSRVATLDNLQEWTKAGVMIREALTPNSAYAAMFVSARGGNAFHRRLTTGAARQTTSGVAVTAPYWVRLERRGTTVTASQSSDGVSWSTVGTISFSQASMFVGLAVASADTGQAATGRFDNVVVRTPTGNQPPTVTLTAPADGANFPANSSVTVSADASDTDGTITSVSFFAGTTPIGTDTTSPYGVTWSNVPAGTHSLTAVARDNNNATTTSAARTITVTGAANQPPSVGLTAPDNGSVFTAPATITIQATAGDTDGTVARVDFFAGTTIVGTDTSAPYEVTWSNVPAGNYSLTAVARDDDGATTTSSARSISVTSPLPQQRRAVFAPSSNHNTAVDRYEFKIFTAGANPDTATPVATRDLGKPAVVGGEISVDVTTTVQSLAPGSYIATVTALGPGGTARSAPASFTR